jgi:hypothetical protein
MTATQHDRLVAALRALGATPVTTRSSKYTCLRLDIVFTRGDKDTIISRPIAHKQYWFVGRAGDLRATWDSPVASNSMPVNDRIKRHLLT